MHLCFDANQDYQLAAMAAVVRLFEGQARVDSALEFSLSAGIAAVPNRLDLAADQLLANLRATQSANGIARDAELLAIAGECTTADGARAVTFPNYSVEMEMETGKTYVYLRTAMELFRVYGMRKFAVVVPSVAIREGVLKTLDVTRGHFAGLYDNAPCRYCVYDSADLNPDWGVVLEPRDQFGRPTGEELLYLVRETKDSTDLTRLRPEEAMKVRCGERLFGGALGVSYRVVTRAADIAP